jgi:hypothetical protein
MTLVVVAIRDGHMRTSDRMHLSHLRPWRRCRRRSERLPKAATGDCIADYRAQMEEFSRRHMTPSVVEGQLRLWLLLQTDSTDAGTACAALEHPEMEFMTQ